MSENEKYCSNCNYLEGGNPDCDECVSYLNKSKKTVLTPTEHEALLGKITSLTHRVGDMEHPLKQLCDNAGIDYQYDGTDHIPYGATDCAETIIYEACENLDDLDISKLICLARNQEEVIRSLNAELSRLSEIKDRIPRSHKDCTCCTGKCLLPMIYHELYGDIR